MFNFGVEIGQLLFLSLVILIGIGNAIARSSFPVTAPKRWLPVYLIGSGSAYWCIERSLGVLV
jgi:hypothetical protein